MSSQINLGVSKGDLDTPALLVDRDAMERNIARMAETFRRARVGWRPHTKGIKVPALAHMLLAAGAHGITCAKVSEAEVMAAAGIADILIANQIVGQLKIERLVRLARQADPIVAVDCVDNIDALNSAASAHGVRLRVVIEVNIGMNRAGTAPGEATIALAREISKRKSLRFVGLMGWEGQTGQVTDAGEKREAVERAVSGLTTSAELCRAEGLPVEIVSCGGTLTYTITAFIPGVTEIQAGGGIFNDVYYRAAIPKHELALTVLATVTSRPTATRVVCDAGKKAMSTDGGLPEPRGIELAKPARFSAEHGSFDMKAPSPNPKIGDKIEFTVGYSDTTVFLHDQLYGVRGGSVEVVWPVSGRGKLQ
jgi:D-serine deaminase-like pyridoxal phosphate-dependent protein